MKSYESQPIKARSDSDFTSKIVATPDPKRPGMYKTTEVVVTLGAYDLDPSNNGTIRVGHKWSHLYGKKNQQTILEMIQTMSEIEA